MISKNLALPHMYSESIPPPGVALVNDLKANRTRADIKVKCITQLPLDTWSSLTAQGNSYAVPCLLAQDRLKDSMRHQQNH